MSPRQVPNLLTFGRLLLAAAAFVFLHRFIHAASPQAAAAAAAAAFWFYLIAVSTDFLDGLIARRFGWTTALGRIADPVVDKVLTLGGMAFLSAAPFLNRPGDFGEVMPVWALVVVLAREFLVTAVRGLVESRGASFPADRFGKWKMVSQSVYVLILIGGAGAVPRQLHLLFLERLRDPRLVVFLFWSMVSLTVFSGLNYMVRAVRILRRLPT